MSELQAIAVGWAEAQRTGKAAALATVVMVRGSAYRRPGARMLITADGETIGAISGGCLERDIVERAKRVMTSGEAAVAHYDTSSDADIVWGLGLGCGGAVQVLIERLEPEPRPNPVPFVAECLQRSESGAVATVFRVVGDAATTVGVRVMLSEAGRTTGGIEDPELASAVMEDLRRALQEGRSATKEYVLSRGRVETLLEVIQPPVPLVIFGAGHDAVPLARLAKEIGWHVTVVDSRPAFATAARFPWADAVVLARPGEALQRVSLRHRTVAMVMTHNYQQDLELLIALMPSPVRYLGVLGPKSRTEGLLQHLRDTGRAIRDADLERLYGPTGIDIGAETPEEVALAIVTEIKAVLAGRTGGFLRDRKGPIHDPVVAQGVPFGYSNQNHGDE